MKVSLATAPTIEPVTLAELRTHLRLDSSNAEPAPGAPTVALAGTGAGNVDAGAHRYRVTFVTADGETDGGTISSAVTTTAGNGKVTVSAIPTGGSLVTSRKLYRTAADASTYLLLATIADNTTTTYADNIADGSLGAGCPSTNTTTDPELTAIIKSAREHVEDWTRRALLTQTWDYYLDEFPEGDSIVLPFGNLATVTHIKYTDSDSTQTTMVVTTEYIVETNGEEHGRIVLPYGVSWPSFTAYSSNPIVIRFVCGWTTAALVPYKIKAAIKMLCADMYEMRGEPTIGQSVIENKTVERPLSSARLWGNFA